jgi:hypothetical protein
LQIHFCINNYRKETLSFEVVNFEGLTMPSSGGRVTPNSWWSLTTPLKMLGPQGVITIIGNFRDAYECEREGMEQVDHALIPDEARLDVEIKRRMNSGTTQCTLPSPEHQRAGHPSGYIAHPPSVDSITGNPNARGCA